MSPKASFYLDRLGGRPAPVKGLPYHGPNPYPERSVSGAQWRMKATLHPLGLPFHEAMRRLNAGAERWFG